MKIATLITAIILTIFSTNNLTSTPDFISFWEVTLNDLLILKGTELDQDKEIIIHSNRVTELDSLRIDFYDDTPCPTCRPKLTIMTPGQECLREIESDSRHYTFVISLVDIINLRNDYIAPILSFSFTEYKGSFEYSLFNLTIK